MANRDTKEANAARMREYYKRPGVKAKFTARMARWRNEPVILRGTSGQCYTFKRKRIEALKRFNLSPENFVRLLEMHDSACHLCRKPFNLNRANTINVDHCYKTGRIRGLLCSSCNTTTISGVDRVGLAAVVVYMAPPEPLLPCADARGPTIRAPSTRENYFYRTARTVSISSGSS